ncbi:hypothetical protein [Streptomyces sp. NPDC048641]|uniref:hypothetical protein n=1 Tax=Streptomyces sp. NPDC048641 TaxID=3154825 RepID=UPI003420FD82
MYSKQCPCSAVVQEKLVRLFGIAASQRQPPSKEDLRADERIQRHARQFAFVVKDLDPVGGVLLLVRAAHLFMRSGSLERERDVGRTHPEPQRPHADRWQQLPTLPFTVRRHGLSGAEGGWLRAIQRRGGARSFTRSRPALTRFPLLDGLDADTASS